MTWLQHALVVGAGRGIGFELVQQLVARGVNVVGTTRSELPEGGVALRAAGARPLRLEVQDEGSVAQAAATLLQEGVTLDLIFCTVGLLHDDALQPERRLADIDPAHLDRLFAVNATGPLLVAKHFLPVVRQQGRKAVYASLSARVGSIEDNRLGGWYGYRASKAAQNMFMRCVATEVRRRARNLIVLSLHPGTVDTELSAPFQRNVPQHKLFSTERACRQLLAIVERADESYHGTFRAWDDTPIPW